MNARRLRAIISRVATEIRRDHPSLALLFIAPVVITGLLTFILREGDTPKVSAVLVIEASGPGAMVGTALTTALEEAGITVTEAPDEAAARAWSRPGRTRWRSWSRLTSRPAGRSRSSRWGSIRRARRPAGCRPGGGVHGRRRSDGRPRAGGRARDSLRDPERRPDGGVRAGHRRVLPLLLRVPADRRQLPAGADRRHAGAADGDARDPRRGGHRIHAWLRAVRHDPGRGAPVLGAGDRPRARDRAAAGIRHRPGDPGGRQPAPRLPGRGDAGAGGREPGDLPVDVRPHGAPGDPVHPDRAGAPVPALGRAVPGQQPAGDPPAAGR